MRKIFLFLSLCILTYTLNAQQTTPFVTAHRGCWIKTSIPENSIAAVVMAKKMGYQAVSIDTEITADGVPVAFHGDLIEKKLHNASDYSAVDKNTRIQQLTFNDLRKNYVTISDSAAFRKPVASLKELLKACKKNNITPMVHSDHINTFKLVQKTMKNNWICQANNDSIAHAVRAFSDCEILVNMDQVTPQDALQRLKAIGGHCGMSTTDPKTLTKTLCLQLRANGFETQSVLFKPAYEVQANLHGVTKTLSDFSFPFQPTIKPTDDWKITSLIMSQKDELNKKWDHYENGGIVLRLWFRGAVIVIVNNDKKYSLVSNGDNMQYISTRFTGIAPSIRIVAAVDTQMAEAEATLYTTK